MAEPDAPQFSDRPTPEPLDDIAVQPPLLVAPPLGINRQFLVPLGARSLTVLEPDLFQPRSSYADSSLFGDSPFFNDPLLAALSKPAPSSSTESLSTSSRAVVQRSTTAGDAQSIQHKTAPLPPLHSPISPIEALSQSGEFGRGLSIQRSDNASERQASEAIESSDFSQAVPEKFAATQEADHHALVTLSEISSTTIAKVEDPSLHNSPSIEGLEKSPSIETTNLSTPLLANEVQRSTTSEANSEPLSEAGAALTVDSKPDSTLESQAKAASTSQTAQVPTTYVESAFGSKTEQISEPTDEASSSEPTFKSTPDVQLQVTSEHLSATQVESAFDSKTEQISEPTDEASSSEPTFKSTPGVQSQATLNVQPKAIDRTDATSTLEPVSAQRSESTIAVGSTETTELTANARAEAVTAPEPELADASTEESSHSNGTIAEQGTGFSQSSTPKAVLPSQYHQSLSTPSTSIPSSSKPEVVARQVAHEPPSIDITALLQSPLESPVQRSLAVDLPTFASPNELAPTETESPNAEIDRTAINIQTTSSSAPTSQLLQAKELEPLPSFSNVPGSKLHSTSPPDAGPPLTEPAQFVSETTAQANPEPQAEPTDTAEPAFRNTQEAFSTQPLNNSIAVTHQPPSNFAQLASNSTTDSSDAAIDTQSPSPLLRTPSDVVQAKGQANDLETSSQPSIDISVVEQHAVASTPSTPPLEQTNQFEENPALARLEPQGISESSLPTSQAPLDLPLSASINRLPLAQATSSLESDGPQAAQVLLQADTTSSLHRSPDQPSTEPSSTTNQDEHEAPLEPLPSPSASSSTQVNLQLKSTEKTSAAAFINPPSTIENANVESLSALSAGPKLDAFDHEASQDHETSQPSASDNQAQALETQPQTLEQTVEASSSTNEALESLQASPEASIQRTPTTSLKSSANATTLTETGITDSQALFSSQPSSSQPSGSQLNSAFNTHQPESEESEVEASPLALGKQPLASLENKEEVSKDETSGFDSVINKFPEPETSVDLPSVQALNLDQASSTHSSSNNSELNSNSLLDSQAAFLSSQPELSFVQPKEISTAEHASLASEISETAVAFGTDSPAAPDSKISDEKVQRSQSSTHFSEAPQENFRSLSPLGVQKATQDNLELQARDIQRQNVQDLEIQSLGSQSLQAQSFSNQSSDVQDLETQILEPQDPAFLLKQEAINQTQSSATQVSIDPLTTETIESSSTIARTIDKANQGSTVFEKAADFAHTEANSTQSATNSIAANSDVVDYQDSAQKPTNASADVDWNLPSTQLTSMQNVVQKREESESARQSSNSPTQETLQNASDTAIASASQAFFLQQPEPKPIPSELETEHTLPASIDHEGLLSSKSAATAQRSLDASIGSSNATANYATLDSSDTSGTSISGLTEPSSSRSTGPSSSRSTEPLLHTQDLPEAQPLPGVQNSVQSASDAAVVQAKPVSPLSCKAEATSSETSSVNPIDGTTEVTIAQPSSLATEAITPSPTVMRPLDLSSPELEAPSSLDAAPARLLELEKQENLTSNHDAVEILRKASLPSEQGNEPDRYLSVSTVAPSAQEAIVGADLSIQNASHTDTSTPPQPQSAQTDPASETVVHTPTSSPSFSVGTPIQRQVTPFADATSQPITIDSLETQHSKSSASHQVTPFADTASQSLAADSLETQYNGSFTLPQVTSLADAAIQPLADISQPLAADSLETKYSESFTAPQVTSRADAAIQPLAADSLDVQPSEPLSPSGTAEAASLETRSLQTSESSPAQSAPVELSPSSHQSLTLSSSSPESRSLPSLEEPIASDSVSQAAIPQSSSVEITPETALPAIVQRTPIAEQTVELNAPHAVDDAVPQAEASVETTLDNPANGLSEPGEKIDRSEATAALPLVLQPLSTLEPLTSSANFFSRASATPPSVQASSQTTPPSNPSPTQQPSKQVVKVDRPTTSWSNFSDLVQRQVTPSARSSDRSTAAQATPSHSVAAALASTSEMIQRQPAQPETVRISRHDQLQSMTTQPSDAVDAKDLEQLAQVIYQQLRQRLRIEQERHGRDGSGRLPW
ncbi:MAG: hypothetical protein ACAF41_15705 [Leptolyngbya sp. BL-A-14]